VPIYGVFAMILTSGTLLLSAAKNEGETK